MIRALAPLALPCLLAGQTPEREHLKPDAPPVQAVEPAPKPAAAPTAEARPGTAPAPAAAPAKAEATGSLSFFSQSYTYYWDRLIKVDAAVDGLKINTIFFNVRKPNVALLRSTEWGTRAQVEVTNAGTRTRIPGFAVAVLDGEGKLLGVATGGSKVTGVKPGETETFDLDFTQVKERLPKGATFILSMELRD